MKRQGFDILSFCIRNVFSVKNKNENKKRRKNAVIIGKCYSKNGSELFPGEKIESFKELSELLERVNTRLDKAVTEHDE